MSLSNTQKHARGIRLNTRRTRSSQGKSASFQQGCRAIVLPHSGVVRALASQYSHRKFRTVCAAGFVRGGEFCHRSQNEGVENCF